MVPQGVCGMERSGKRQRDMEAGLEALEQVRKSTF